MSELNREQIIKALECCVEVKCDSVAICPRRENCTNRFVCSANLKKDALALIKELTEENESLKKNQETVASVCKQANEHYNALYEDAKAILISETRVDTVRKMQERLNEAFNSHSYNCRDCIKSKVDQIAKEMLEGTENGK